jgi:two-component system, NtrC family, nitrogen regulation response regulator NtrX
MANDILVVDDEADIRELVAGILEDEGHEVRMARDSDSALEAINGCNCLTAYAPSIRRCLS